MTLIRNILSIKTDDSKKRIYYLDIIRGILVLLVLYHHATAPLHKYVLQFHMPALFILSGYTEYILNREVPFASYLKSKFYRLIVPYISFEVLNIFLFIAMQCLRGEIDISFKAAAFSIVTCINNSYIGLYGRLWFLPAIFVSSIFAYVIKKIFKDKPVIIGVCCLLMFGLAYVSSAVLPLRLPFTVDIAFLGTAFFMIGHLAGGIIKHILERKNYGLDLLLLAASMALFVLCNIVADPTCYMYNNQYNDFPFMVVCALAGSALTFILAKLFLAILDKIAFLRNVVLWYSVHSLTVFPVHLTIKVLSIPLLARIGLNNWYCLFAIMVTLTVLIVNVIDTYFPFMVGKVKKVTRTAT